MAKKKKKVKPTPPKPKNREMPVKVKVHHKKVESVPFILIYRKTLHEIKRSLGLTNLEFEIICCMAAHYYEGNLKGCPVSYIRKTLDFSSETDAYKQVYKLLDSGYIEIIHKGVIGSGKGSRYGITGKSRQVIEFFNKAIRKNTYLYFNPPKPKPRGISKIRLMEQGSIFE